MSREDADRMRSEILADRERDAQRRKERPQAYNQKAPSSAKPATGGGSGSQASSGSAGGDRGRGGMVGRAKRAIATRAMKNEEALAAAKRAMHFENQTTDSNNR